MRQSAISSIGLTIFMSGLGLCWTIVGLADDAKLDVSKLKPGDKLEFKLAGKDWQSVDYIGPGPGNTLLVKRSEFPRPVPEPINLLRLPAAANAASDGKAASQPNDVASAPDQVVADKPRTWNDRTGKFKLEAVLVRVEDGTVVLRRTDNNSELKVPLEKLSDADQKYASDYQAGKKVDQAKSEIVGGAKAKGLSDDKARSGGASAAITPTDYQAAPAIEWEKTVEWKYQPDGSPSGEKLKPAKVPLPPAVDVFERPVRLLLLSKEKKAFVVNLDTDPGQPPVSVVQACNLETGKMEGSAVFGQGVVPLDISPDGMVVLAGASDGGMFGKPSELQIHARDGNKVKLIAAWKPYDSSSSAKKDGRSIHPSRRPSLGQSSSIRSICSHSMKPER